MTNQANIDCLLRKMANAVKDARDINKRGGDQTSTLRHIASLLGSVELEVAPLANEPICTECEAEMMVQL